MKLNKLMLLLVVTLSSIPTFSQIVNNEIELNNAINTATAGTTITLSNGTWDDVFISISDKNGTASAPITITAQTPGAVVMTGNSRVYMKGSYLTISGLVFQNADNLVASSSEIEPVFELKECNNCKVINNKIDSYNGTEAQKTLKFKWILADGQYNEIAYNSFIGKYGIGSIINDNRNSSEEDFLKIHHNYFADRTPINGFNENNDQDAIRIGNSSTSLNDSSTEVYDNYFYNFFGEIEIISNKSGNNKYYNNTFRDYSGSLTLRHGNNCDVFNNFFFAENNPNSAGLRVIGEGHKIYNNYIEGINSLKYSGAGSGSTGGINITNGRVDSELDGYYQVKDAYIVNNTFVNCDYALRVGTTVKDDLSLAPDNIVIANNTMLNSSTSAFADQTTATNSTYEGNITQNGTWDLTNGIDNNSTVTSNLLVAGDNFYELTATSPAIDAGVGSYTFLTSDILGGNRGTNFDAGAEEFNSNGNRLPYKSEDVGVTIGFGATAISEPTLTTNISSLFLDDEANANNLFTIIANVDWTISESLSWLTLSETTGSNIAEITVTVTANTTGVERSGTIVINENGSNNLSTTITITQSDGTFGVNDAVELSVDAVIGVGTQVNTDGSITNTPENTIDNDTDTRWSADATDGSAYLTYDLGCIRTVTNVSIYFHKSTVRTTKISIATSEDGTNFTNAHTEVSSALLTTEAFEDFSIDLVAARYIRIYGFGNSEGSGWNSIEEVKFYGNPSCSDSSLSILDNNLSNKGISIYPIPVANQILHISSKELLINKVSIYNIVGQKILDSNANNTLKTEIPTNNLVAGVYYLVLEGIGTSKIIIE